MLLDLERAELASPASKWSRRHLLAYRLLVQPETAFLTTFRVDHQKTCPVYVCKTDHTSPQQVDRAKLNDLLNGPVDLNARHGLLFEHPEGYFWASLARACHPDRTEEFKVYPNRIRRRPSTTGYVDSSQAIQGSSSPVQPSSSEYDDMDNSQVDEDENEERRRIPEDISVRLLADFTSYVLQGCLRQQHGSIEIRTRIDRRRARANIAGTTGITCEDDGGICAYRQLTDGWEAERPYLALFEGKRAFRQLRVDPHTDRSSPMVSDDTVAQYLGEAVITWQANRSSLKQEYNLSYHYFHPSYYKHLRNYSLVCSLLPFVVRSFGLYTSDLEITMATISTLSPKQNKCT